MGSLKMTGKEKGPYILDAWALRGLKINLATLQLGLSR